MNKIKEGQVYSWIDGYYFVYLGDPSADIPARAFDKAKKEYIETAQKNIADVEAMTFNRWATIRLNGVD